VTVARAASDAPRVWIDPDPEARPGSSFFAGLAAAAAVAASPHAATSRAAGHAAARANGTAAPLTGTGASQGRSLAPAVGARRTFADAPIARAEVDGRTRSVAPVNAPIPNNVDAYGDAIVAIPIIVVVVVIVQIGRAVAIGGRVVTVGTRRIGITVDAQLAVAVAVIPIAGPSGTSGKAQKA
jgi:hypothetical protein